MLGLLCGLVLGYEGMIIGAGACLGFGISNMKYWSRYRQLLLEIGICVGFCICFLAPFSALCFFRGIRGKWFAGKNFWSLLAVLLICYGAGLFFFDFHPPFYLSATKDHNRIAGHLFPAMLCAVILTFAGILYIRSFLLVQLGLDRYNPDRFFILLLTFGLVGSFSFFFPLTGGSGNELIRGMNWNYPLQQLLFLFSLKFIFSIMSSTCGIPGGFMIPVLALGGTGGKLFGEFCCLYGWIMPEEINCFVLYGMCAMFVSVVRLPFTGIMLILETTWQIQCVPGVLLSGLIGYYLPELLKQAGLYDLLQQRFHARTFARQQGLAMPVNFDEIRKLQYNSMTIRQVQILPPVSKTGNGDYQ